MPQSDLKPGEPRLCYGCGYSVQDLPTLTEGRVQCPECGRTGVPTTISRTAARRGRAIGWALCVAGFCLPMAILFTPDDSIFQQWAAFRWVYALHLLLMFIGLSLVGFRLHIRLLLCLALAVGAFAALFVAAMIDMLFISGLSPDVFD